VKRLFWVALGATAGVLAVRKVSRTADRFAPSGLAASLVARLGDFGDAIRVIGADVRAAMHEREEELRDALGVNGDGQPAGESCAWSLADPTDPRVNTTMPWRDGR